MTRIASSGLDIMWGASAGAAGEEGDATHLRSWEASCGEEEAHQGREHP